MTQEARMQADYELRQHLREALPWRWRWTGWVYRFGVWRYGGITAFDSCDSTKGVLCRHKVARPAWMQELHAEYLDLFG